jgi:hypothetical protein
MVFLILSSRLHLDLPNSVFPSGFPNKALQALFFHVSYMPCLSESPQFDHSNNIRQEVLPLKGKVVLCLTKNYAMKEWIYTLRFLHVGNIWSRMVSFTLRPLNPRYPLGGPHGRSGRSGLREQNIL